MNTFSQAIAMRISIRTYTNVPIETNILEKLETFFRSNTVGPFGNEVRFQIIDATTAEKNELKKFGTYGLISGMKFFIAGAVKNGHHAMEDFGFCMEKNILFATSLGLGTVWLGGFLNRHTFADKINLVDNEVIPAVTPIGYSSVKRSIIDRVITGIVKARKRKAFEEIFFDDNIDNPLYGKDCGKYFEALEAVRIGPSASNKQPWRIVRDKTHSTFHFFLNENPAYNRAFKEIKIQHIDMGIAMSHFELICREQNIKGKWVQETVSFDYQKYQYITTWKETA
jgi:nitroreductase